MAVRKVDNKPSVKQNETKEQKFFIEYNPYKNETVFKLNGENTGGKFETYRKGFRLQQFLEPRQDWQGLIAEIYNRCRTKENVVVEFKGREADFNDILISLNASEYKDKIELVHIPAKNDNDMIDEIGTIIDKIEGYHIDELKDENVKNKITEAYNSAKDAKLKVSVIATMSSGKSTLINSLLATDILPSQNEACTATVARILDNDNKKEYDCVCKNKNEEEITRKSNVQKSDLEEYNDMGKNMDNDDPNKIIFMDIEGPIPGISSEKMTLLLQDTPGPNNSVDEKHKELTEEMIRSKKNSVILYIMNATQLRVEDDYKLLNIVSSVMKDGGKQARDRFIFVVNKFDDVDLEKEDATKIIQNTKEYLAEFGIEQPNVFPVSARAALLLKLEHYHGSDILTRQERNDLNTYKNNFGDEEYVVSHFEKLADISIGVRSKLEKRLENADEYETALIHTGIPAIEESINEYLEKYAYPIKISDAVSELVSLINGLDMTRKFKQRIVDDNECREELIKQVAVAEEKQKNAKKYQEEFQKRIAEFSLKEDGENSPQELKKEVSKQIRLLQEEYVGKAEESDNAGLFSFFSATKSGNVEIEASKAYRKLQSFEKRIRDMQDGYASKIQFIIENDINAKGNQISSEYAEIIRKLFEDIKIDGFDFSEIPEIERYQMSDLDTIIDNHSRTEVEYDYDYVEVRNPNRRWGQFWKPKYITKEIKRKVGEKEMVDMQSIIVDECSKLEQDFEDSIDKAFNEGKKDIEQFKKIFSNNLKALSDKVSEIIDDMKKDVAHIDALQKELENNKERLSDIENLAKQVNGILNF